MKYRTVAFLFGFLILDIVTVPIDEFSTHREVRGQTDKPAGVTEEKIYVSDDGIVHLQSRMDIMDLIKAMSEIKEEPYVIDGSVKPREISIITPEGGMKKDDVLMFFDTVLRLNGLAVVKSDGINKIVNSSDISGASTPVETDK